MIYEFEIKTTYIFKIPRQNLLFILLLKVLWKKLNFITLAPRRPLLLLISGSLITLSCFLFCFHIAGFLAVFKSLSVLSFITKYVRANLALFSSRDVLHVWKQKLNTTVLFIGTLGNARFLAQREDNPFPWIFANPLTEIYTNSSHDFHSFKKPDVLISAWTHFNASSLYLSLQNKTRNCQNMNSLQ